MSTQSADVQVYTRFRPLNAREQKIDADACGEVTYLDVGDDLSALDGGSVFPRDTEQVQVYDTVARSTVDDVVAGFNGTIFAYGQTGAGKTFTMMGERSSDELMGVIPRAAKQIFEHISAQPGNITATVRVSYLEVYREQINDLLTPDTKPLHVRGDAKSSKGRYVQGLAAEYVASEEQLLQILDRGEQQRKTGATKMNAGSSRSHSVFTIIVQHRNEETEESWEGKLNLVDLAGSEKVGKTGATGKTLKEAQMINKSLSALGNVIKALADKRAHVPYRDSQLTQILQSSLGGNTKTSMIVACSPHPDNAAETKSSIAFGKRAKTVQTKVTKNLRLSPREQETRIRQLEEQVAKLLTENTDLLAQLEKAGLSAKSSKSPERIHKALQSAEVRMELEALKRKLAQTEVQHKEMAEAMASAQDEAARLQQELNIYTGWEENSRREPIEKLFDAAYENRPAELATILASGDVGVNDRGIS
jgi:kinesin family protein 5